MNQRLAIMMNSPDASQQNAVTAYLQGAGYQVWHWYPDVWLVYSPLPVSAKALSEALDAFIGTTHRIVFEVPSACHYFGRSTKESWDWMRTYWGFVAT